MYVRHLGSLTPVGLEYLTSVQLHVKQFVFCFFLVKCYLVVYYPSVGSFEKHKNSLAVAMRLLFKTVSNQYEALQSFAGMI